MVGFVLARCDIKKMTRNLEGTKSNTGGEEPLRGLPVELASWFRKRPTSLKPGNRGTASLPLVLMRRGQFDSHADQE